MKTLERQRSCLKGPEPCSTVFHPVTTIQSKGFATCLAGAQVSLTEQEINIHTFLEHMT